MNCPLCLKRNINSNIICVDSDCYVCEDDSCILCISEDEINKLKDTSSSDKVIIDLCDSDTEMYSDKKNTNECENMTPFNDTGENVFSSRKSDNSDNMIFNWLKIPFMKIHSKVIYILLLHTDLLNFEKASDALTDAKAEYSLCSTFAKHFNRDLLKSISHQFIMKLSATFQCAQTENTSFCKIDDRILRSFKQYFNKYDPKNHLACQFTTSMSCQSCQLDSSKTITDYFISIPLNKTYFKIASNQISYIVQCKGCSKNARVKVTIRKLPHLMILHCPDGLKGKISPYDRNFYFKNRICSLAAVVQCRSEQPLIDCSDRNLSSTQYNSMKSLEKPATSDSYCVSVQDKIGWYNLSDSKPDFCEPVKTLEINKGSEVRFIIYGELHDKSKYDRPFSIGNFVRDFNDGNKIDINEIFSINRNKELEKHKGSNTKKEKEEKNNKSNERLTKNDDDCGSSQFSTIDTNDFVSTNQNRQLEKDKESKSKKEKDKKNNKSNERLTRKDDDCGSSQFSTIDTNDFVSTNQNRELIQTKKIKSKKKITGVNVGSARKDNFSDKLTQDKSVINESISTNKNNSSVQPRKTKPKMKENSTNGQMEGKSTNKIEFDNPDKISEPGITNITSTNQTNVLLEPEISIQRMSEWKISDYLRQNNEKEVDLDREEDLLPTQETACQSSASPYPPATVPSGVSTPSPSFVSSTILSNDDCSNFSDNDSKSSHSYEPSLHSRSTSSRISEYTESGQCGVSTYSPSPQTGKVAASISHLISQMYGGGLPSSQINSYNKFNSTYPSSIGVSSNQSSTLDQSRLNSIFSNLNPSSSSASTAYRMNPASVDSQNFVTDSSDSTSTTTSMKSLHILTRKRNHTIDDLIMMKKLKNAISK